MNWETLTPIIDKATQKVENIKDIEERLGALIFYVSEMIEQAEREACAKVCETLWDTPDNGMSTEEECYGDQCATAIRARAKA
jgi:hypothetical protein